MTIEPNYDTSAPVLVTGATGYVAGWIVKKLLAQGFTVHAAVRDPSNEAKVAHLKAMEGGTLKLFKADLLEDGSYAEAMEGCSVVFHTASPFTTRIKDPQRDMVDPAVNGTKNIMTSVAATESVKRVVLTSSCVAIYGDAKDIQDYPNGIMTEEQWNTTSTLTHQTYSYSKVEAEKAAWAMADAQDRYKLVVINPSFVIGAGTADAQTSESFNLVKQLGDGTMKMGTIPMEIGMVAVQDVAEAHLRAAFIDSASGRYITSAEESSMLKLGGWLRDGIGDAYPFPKSTMPKWLLWLVGPMVSPGVTREFVSKNLNYPWRFDNSKIKRELGMEFSPVKDAAVEMFNQLIETGAVKKAG